MKGLDFAKGCLPFLSALCNIATAHPRHSLRGPRLPNDSGYDPYVDMSPVPRGILGEVDVVSGILLKRQCGTGLYCPATNFCCTLGYSCCSYTFCCAPGYACPVSGSCVAADVVTVTYTSTYVVTSKAISTVFASSTSFIVITSTDYTTVTTRMSNGVSTSTIWTTVTTTQVMKRAAPIAPTPAATGTYIVQDITLVPIEPALIGGQTPIADLLLRALADIGLVAKRAVTSYQTVVYTSTSYTYSYTTIGNVITSSSSTKVLSTITSTIMDNASSTTTVTSTTTSTVKTQSDSQRSPSPSNNSSSSPLSMGGIVGISVSVGCSVLGLVFGVAFKVWSHRRQRKKQEQY